MGLRNAFEEVATERTLRLILAATNYARDINDRMRVIVDGGTVGVSQLYIGASSTAGTYRSWYDANAVFTTDQREQQRLQSMTQGQISRQRWTYN